MILQRGKLSIDGQVRIQDGTESCGRLEVYAYGDWRAVCPGSFDQIDATLACQDIGFRYVCGPATITMRNDEYI